MSGEPSQEDNPFFEAQWKFVNEVADLLREQKTTDIESPLLQGIRHALDKHQIQEIRGTLEQPQIPENEAQVKVGAVIEDIASLLFDGVYSCAFINDPVLLSSGYIIDKAVFNLLSAENLLSDTALSHPANAVTKQLVELFHAFLKVFTVEKNRELISLPSYPWLIEHFSDDNFSTSFRAKKEIAEEQYEIMDEWDVPSRDSSSSVVEGEGVVESLLYIKEIESKKKACIELQMMSLIESLGKEIEALTEAPKVSEKKQVKDIAIEEKSFNQESVQTETMVSNQSNSLQRFIGWLILFFILAVVLILALSTFLPGFYQAFILFVSSNSIIAAAVLAAILIVFGVFAMRHFFLGSLKNSFTVTIPSVQEIQEKNQEKLIPIRQFLIQIRRPSPNKVLAPLLESALDLLDARQKNVKKYTQLITRSRLANDKGHQLRNYFLQQSITWLEKERFEKYELPRQKAEAAELKRQQKSQQRKAEAMEDREAALKEQAGTQPELGYVRNPYKNPRFQPVDEDSERKTIYTAFYTAYWGNKDGYESDGSSVELVDKEGYESEKSEQLIGSDNEVDVEVENDGENNRPGVKVIFSS